MAGALEARAIITAEDNTGKAFDSVRARIAGLQKQISLMDRVEGLVSPVAKSVDAIANAAARATVDMGHLGAASRTISTLSTAMGSVDRASAGMTASMARSTSSVAKLSTELTSAEAKLKAIGEFKMSSRALDQAGLSLRKSQQDARLLTAEMAKVGTPNKQMEVSLAAAHAATMRLTEEFKVEGGAAREARAALSELGVPLNRLRSEEERLEATIVGVTQALHEQAAAEHSTAAATAENARAAERAARDEERLRVRQAREQHQFAQAREHGVEHHGFGRYALQSAAAAVGAGEIVHLGAEAVGQGAELQHERLGLANAGRTPREIAEIEDAARKVVAAQPTASMLDAIKVVSETTMAFGSVEHAVANLPFMLQTMSILKASGGEHIKGDAGAVGRALAKTFEERQTRPADFEAEAKAMIPAMVASGGTFNPEQLYAFAQQAKSALPSLSTRFLSRIAPSIIGANGGDRAGTALNAFESVISGKANDKKQAQEWMSLGLLDPSKVIMKNGQATSWRSGAVKDTFLAMTDPLAWAEKYLIPAMKAKGLDPTNRLAVKQVLDTMFRNQNANLFASEITQEASRQRLHKDEGLINEVGGFDDIYQRNLEDFNVATGALKDSIGNLASAATSPLMGRAAVGISSLAGVLNKVAAYGFAHPEQAAGAGIVAGGASLALAGRLAYQLNTGFGLGKSATALDASAVALEEAAMALKGGAARSNFPGGEPHPGGSETPGTSPGFTSLMGRGLFMGLNLGDLAMGMPDQLKKAATDNAPVDSSVEREAAMGDAVRHWFAGRVPDTGTYRPEHSILLRTFPSEVTNFGGNELHRNDEMPAGHPSGVVPVAIVSAPPTAADFHDHGHVTNFDGNALHRNDEMPAGMIHLDTGHLDTAAQRLNLLAQLMANLDGLDAKITVDMSSADAAIAKLERLKGAAASAGTTGSTGPSRVVADPGVGRSR